MNRARLIAGMVLAGLVLAGGRAPAQTFNTGIPPGWVCQGTCGALGADGVATLPPTGSSKYGYITTAGGTFYGGLPGVGGTGFATNGTILQSPLFTAHANDQLNFFFNYITSDGYGFNDYAWARLLNQSMAEVALLFTARTMISGDAIPGQNMPTPTATLTPATVPIIAGGPNWSPLGSWSGACYGPGCGYTDWVFSQYVIPQAGNYVLEFGVTNWNDEVWDSGMAFDGITVGNVPIDDTVTPEPASMLLLGSGLAALAALRRRRTRA